MANTEEFYKIKEYLDNQEYLDIENKLLRVLMNKPNINHQTIESYFDRDPDYRIAYERLRQQLS